VMGKIMMVIDDTHSNPNSKKIALQSNLSYVTFQRIIEIGPKEVQFRQVSLYYHVLSLDRDEHFKSTVLSCIVTR
jgi:hypothetical protein